MNHLLLLVAPLLIEPSVPGAPLQPPPVAPETQTTAPGPAPEPQPRPEQTAAPETAAPEPELEAPESEPETAAPESAPAAEPAETESYTAVQEAIALTQDAAKREQGIGLLRLHLEAHPNDRQARHALARAFAWSGQHAAALAEFDHLLASAEANEARTLQRERLQVLAWQGKFRKAIGGYRKLLASDPADVDARVGLVQALRWSGRPLAARAAAKKVLQSLSQRPDVQKVAEEELAWSYASVGQGRAAERKLGDLEPSTELADRLTQLRRPHLGISTAVSGNSFNITRTSPRVKTRIPLPYDLGVEVAAGATVLQQRPVRWSYTVLGGALTASVDRVDVRAGVGAYLAKDFYRVDGDVGVVVHAIDQLHFSFAYRHRPLVESALPTSTDEGAYHGSGIGGAQVLDEAMAISVDQVGGGMNIAPGPWGYIYLDGHYLWLNDGNRGFTTATGFGIDVLGFGRRLPVSLLARWDSYFGGFEDTRTAYFTTKLLDVHSVGPEIVARFWQMSVSAAAGGTLPLIAEGQYGWFAGGAMKLNTDRVSLSLRGEYREDPYYSQWRAWLGIDVRL